MAIPDARTSSSDGAKTLIRHDNVIRNGVDDHDAYSLSLSHSFFFDTVAYQNNTRDAVYAVASSSIHSHAMKDD